MNEPIKTAGNPPVGEVNAPSGNGHGLQRLPDGNYVDLDIDPAVTADMWWGVQERAAGRFDDCSGEHLAILEHQVIDRDRDPLALRLRAAAARGVPPERIVVLYVDFE